MLDAARFIDPDLRDGYRKAQFKTAADLDPRWRVSLHHNLGTSLGLGRGLYSPYVSRGDLRMFLDGGSFGITRDGWALRLPADTAGLVTNTGGLMAWWPAAEGSFVSTFRASWASSSPPTGNVNIAYVSNLTGGTFVLQPGDIFSGTLFCGWVNGGTDTRASFSASGLWASGDLVQLGCSWGPAGTFVYVNGKLVGSNATAASVPAFSATGAAMGIGQSPNTGGANPNAGWQSPILVTTFLDRTLNASEWREIATRPLNWMFRPSPALVAAALGQPATPFNAWDDRRHLPQLAPYAPPSRDHEVFLPMAGPPPAAVFWGFDEDTRPPRRAIYQPPNPDEPVPPRLPVLSMSMSQSLGAMAPTIQIVAIVEGILVYDSLPSAPIRSPYHPSNYVEEWPPQLPVGHFSVNEIFGRFAAGIIADTGPATFAVSGSVDDFSSNIEILQGLLFSMTQLWRNFTPTIAADGEGTFNVNKTIANFTPAVTIYRGPPPVHLHDPAVVVQTR